MVTVGCGAGVVVLVVTGAVVGGVVGGGAAVTVSGSSARAVQSLPEPHWISTSSAQEHRDDGGRARRRRGAGRTAILDRTVDLRLGRRGELADQPVYRGVTRTGVAGVVPLPPGVVEGVVVGVMGLLAMVASTDEAGPGPATLTATT